MVPLTSTWRFLNDEWTPGADLETNKVSHPRGWFHRGQWRSAGSRGDASQHERFAIAADFGTDGKADQRGKRCGPSACHDRGAVVFLGALADATDRIIYESDTGRLFFDRDGTGATAKLHFATIGTNLEVTNGDFFVF